MKDIAICIVINDQYYQTRFCIENLLQKTKLPVKLYFLNNACKNDRLLKYVEEIAERHYKNLCVKYENHPKKDEILNVRKWEIIKHSSDDQNATPLSVAKANNVLLKYVAAMPDRAHDYICIFPTTIFVNNGWLEDLVTSCEIVVDSGLLGIRTGDEKIKLTPVLHHSEKNEDYLKNVWVPENNLIEGVCLFHKAILEKTGLYDEDERLKGYFQAEFSFRVGANMYKNFYITKQTAIKVKHENEFLFPEKTQDSALHIRQEIERMASEDNYKK